MQNDFSVLNKRRVDGDKMLDWATQLKVLGETISALAYHESDALAYTAEELGRLISYLSDNLKKAIEVAFPVIQDAFSSDDGSLGWELKQKLARLKRADPSPLIADRATETLEKIEAFLIEVKEISELKTEFLKIREKAFTGQNKTVGLSAVGQR